MNKVYLMIDSKLDASQDRYLAACRSIDYALKAGSDFSIGLNNRVQAQWITTQYEMRADVIMCN
jgi:hypothetical protein